jgi:hypothetical protein
MGPQGRLVSTDRVLDKAAFFNLVNYKPHSVEQAKYHQSTARFKVPCCGRRFGKSTMAGYDLAPQMLTPKKRFWIVGPTYDLGEKEFRVVWNSLIIDLKMGRDKRVRKAYNKRSGDMYIELPWQTRLEVRSADHPENLVGEALDGAIMSEAAKQKIETWERFIRPALADRRGWATFPTTPEGFNWLYQLWVLGQNPDFADYESWKFPSWANPAVYPGGRQDPEIKLLEATTTPEWFAQEIGADFASFVGKIFPEWEESTHVRKVEFNPAWPNYMCFDWGYTNPLAAVEFQVTPWDEIRVWREHYQAFTTLEEHIRIIKARPQPEGYRLDMAFGDPADPEAAVYVSQKLVGCWAAPEVKSLPWREGIDLMGTFMRPRATGSDLDEYGTPETRPAFLVDFSCPNTIGEFNNYRSQEAVKGKNVPEMGQKIKDHAIDAIRYGILHLFVLGAGSSLSDVMSGEGSMPIGDQSSAGTFFTMNSSGGMEF